MNTTFKTITGVCVFAIAMAALESAVVVYLRELYYPEGFTVAFRLIDEGVIKIELLRELATLVMLGSVGYLAGRTYNERLAYFFLSFAVWDIFYYAWLKILIGWPASFLEWDILFLIPFTWLGPVSAPVICSVTMIALAMVLLSEPRPVSRITWSLLTGGSMVILYTFMADYGGLIVNNGFLMDYPRLLRNKDFLEIASGFVPQSYNWLMFWVGELLIVTGIYLQYRGASGISRLDSFAGLAGNRSAD